MYFPLEFTLKFHVSGLGGILGMPKPDFSRVKKKRERRKTYLYNKY
jgi:hypothetical protein